MNLRAGTGVSEKRDAFEAGKEAAAEAVSALGGEEAALVFVFCMPDYDLPRLLEGVRSVTGAARLTGATGSGEIAKGGYMGFGAGVAVTAATAGPYRFGLASASRIYGDLDRAGQELARRSGAEAGPSPHSAMILLADCMAGDLQSSSWERTRWRAPGPRSRAGPPATSFASRHATSSPTARR